MNVNRCLSEVLLEEFGRIDIYVFDQLLRGRIDDTMTVLDAGCGGGRNSVYLMRVGAEVFGVDADPDSVERMRAVASDVAPGLAATNFRVARLAELPFEDASFDAVICSAVLHFSRDPEDFERSVREMWRVLRSGGVFFARLASTIGLGDAALPLGDGVGKGGAWFRLPDGSDRFLVGEDDLLGLTARLGAEQLDPLKTTLVQNQRAMTTWVLRKP